MSNEKSRAQQNADALRYSMMSSDRPLDSLLPELSAQSPRVPRTALHSRILHLGPDEGDAWVLALWADPGSAMELHTQVRNLLEATLLAHLCQTAEAGEALDRAPATIQLLAFCDVPYDMQGALHAFGLKRQDNTSLNQERIDLLRKEGTDAGWTVPAQPSSTWSVAINQPDPDEPITQIHRQLRERLEGDFWGNEPGAFSLTAAAFIKKDLDINLSPDGDSLDQLEAILVRNHAEGEIRWIPPILFQALCDFIGVITAGQWKHNVEWSLCEPDDGTFAPPPIFRVTRSDNKRQEHLAIGQHLMRWCIMPRHAGEEIPSVREWLESEFALMGSALRH